MDTRATPQHLAPGKPGGERRVQPRLREIYEEALGRVAPFFERPANGWGGDLEYCAYRLMREQYSDLSVEEVYVFLVAARAMYAARRAQRLPARESR